MPAESLGKLPKLAYLPVKSVWSLRKIRRTSVQVARSGIRAVVWRRANRFASRHVSRSECGYSPGRCLDYIGTGRSLSTRISVCPGQLGRAEYVRAVYDYFCNSLSRLGNDREVLILGLRINVMMSVPHLRKGLRRISDRSEFISAPVVDPACNPNRCAGLDRLANGGLIKGFMPDWYRWFLFIGHWQCRAGPQSQ